jgi:hypothetical protein
MINNYHDAMAICRHYGNSYLFIRFTCNVNLPEIQIELKKHTSYMTEDKLDIVTAYRAKLVDMLSFIKSRKPLDKPSRWWSSDKSLGPRGLLPLWSQVRTLWLLI